MFAVINEERNGFIANRGRQWLLPGEIGIFV
jgi:hypothetical protein